MLENRSVAVLVAIALFAARAWSQTPGLRPFSGTTPMPGANTGESLVAPAAAERFRQIARDLALSKSITGPQVDQGIILLTAAKSLDRTVNVEPLLLELVVRHGRKDYSDQVLAWLQNYLDQSADRAVVMGAVQYLLDRQGTAERKQAVLEALVKRIGNRNPAIDSEIATLLGLRMLEKGNKDAARFYLLQGYTNNKYNKVAFAKLAELAPNEIGPAIFLEHLRLVLRENPLNINSAVGFAQYAERLQLYDLAAESYQFCAELFRYLYPAEPLPPHIYLPWAISSYNGSQGQQTCLRIAERVRGAGQFDILLEAIAGKAAAKAGRPEEAGQIFRQAESRARQLLQSAAGQSPAARQGTMAPAVQVNAKQIAWFYCFADIRPEEAVLWANQAYSVEPNSPTAGALLAYALSLKNDLEWAKPLLASFEHTQIADLVQARLHVAKGDKAAAIQTLRTSIAKDAGSLAAEKAKEMLRTLGIEYVSPVDAGAIMTYLSQTVGTPVVPQFLSPDGIIDVQFSIRGGDFSYGNELDGVVTILNRGTEPLVLTADSMFQGNLRVSARVSGDVQKEIPELRSQTVRTDLTIAPGRSLSHTMRLSAGELRPVLMDHPQAALDLQFTLYLDPVTTAAGAISNRLVDVKPVVISVRRPAAEITANYVRSRFNAISTGLAAQKIQTARLFTGLLREQQVMTEHAKALYPYRYAEWLPELLRSSLLSSSGLLLGRGSEDWVVKVNAIADLLSLQIDSDLSTAIAKNLNDPQWPVRLMAVYCLAIHSGSNFNAVLDWVSQQDPNELVRSMAMSLRAGPASAVSMGSAAGELTTIRP